MTVAEQMQEALANDHSLLAHALFMGLQKGYWRSNDSADSINFDQLDFAELEKMTADNVLSLETNSLYTVPLGNGSFAMYFAPDEEKAKVLHKRTFGTFCEKAILMEYGLDMSMYNPETNKHQTWRKIRSEMPELPAYAGLFRK